MANYCRAGIKSLRGTVSMAMIISQPYKFFLISLDTVFGNSKLEENYQE
jgi:hypothetical protein